MSKRVPGIVREMNERFMPDTAEILRPSVPSSGYPSQSTTGPPPPASGDSISVVEADIPCRVNVVSGSEQYAQGAQQAVRRHRVHLLGTVDVKEDDRIRVTRGADGAVLVYNVSGVETGSSFGIQTTCECTLREE